MPGEKRLSGHGVSWCATCDGFFFREQDIAVIGGGDSAMEEATFLTRFARSVTIVHRRDTLRASKIMQDRAISNPKIKFAWDSEVAEVLGEDRVTGLRLRNLKTGEESTLEVTGMFVAIGHDPRSELFAGQLADRRRGLPPGGSSVDADGDRRRVRRGGCRRPDLPAGRDGRRDRLRRRARCRALAGRPRGMTTLTRLARNGPGSD